MVMMMLIRDILTTFAFLKGHCISMKNFGEHHRNLPVPLHSFVFDAGFCTQGLVHAKHILYH